MIILSRNRISYVISVCYNRLWWVKPWVASLWDRYSLLPRSFWRMSASFRSALSEMWIHSLHQKSPTFQRKLFYLVNAKRSLHWFFSIALFQTLTQSHAISDWRSLIYSTNGILGCQLWQNALSCLPWQMCFPIGAERVICLGSKQTKSLGRTKLPTSLGKQ